MRKWKIMYWEKEELGAKEELLYVKEDDIDEVIKFCKMKGLKSYCIFDDLGLNIFSFGNGVGGYNTVSKHKRKMALEQKEKEKNEGKI